MGDIILEIGLVGLRDPADCANTTAGLDIQTGRFASRVAAATCSENRERGD